MPCPRMWMVQRTMVQFRPGAPPTMLRHVQLSILTTSLFDFREFKRLAEEIAAVTGEWRDRRAIPVEKIAPRRGSPCRLGFAGHGDLGLGFRVRNSGIRGIDLGIFLGGR